MSIEQTMNYYEIDKPRKDDLRDQITFKNKIFNQVKMSQINQFTKTMAALDSCATNGVCPHEELLINVRESDNQMLCGGGNMVKTSKMGDLVIYGYNKDKELIKMTIRNMFIDPKSPYTIISSTKATRFGGFEILQKGRVMALVNKKGDHLLFDQNYSTKNGFLPCMNMKMYKKEYLNVKTEYNPDKKAKYINVNKAHQILGHASRDTTELTAKQLNWKLTGDWKQCTDCSLAKIKKTKLPSKTVRFKNVGENELFIGTDISKGPGTNYGGSNFWVLIVDISGRSQMTWSYFLKEKSGMSDCMLKWINEMFNKGKLKKGMILRIRLDNSGENNAMQEKVKKDGLRINWEYTAVATPQQNGSVERKFPTLKSKIKSNVKCS